MDIKLLGYCLFFMFLSSCKNGDVSKSEVETNKFKESKNKFKKELERFNNCKNEYEKSTGHKIVIDIKNGSGISGLAKMTSSYLRDLCYDTYYDNLFDNNGKLITNIYYSEAELHKQDKSIQKQLREDLGSVINLSTQLSPNKEADITLIVGKNYRELDIFKNKKQ